MKYHFVEHHPWWIWFSWIAVRLILCQNNVPNSPNTHQSGWHTQHMWPRVWQRHLQIIQHFVWSYTCAYTSRHESNRTKVFIMILCICKAIYLKSGLYLYTHKILINSYFDFHWFPCQRNLVPHNTDFHWLFLTKLHTSDLEMDM